MKDDLRPLFDKDPEEEFAIDDRDQGLVDIDWRRRPQLLADVKQAALVVVDNDQPSRLKPHQQAAQLRPDRTGGTRHHHGLTGNLLGSQLDLQLPGRASHQVVGGQAAEM